MGGPRSAARLDGTGGTRIDRTAAWAVTPWWKRAMGVNANYFETWRRGSLLETTASPTSTNIDDAAPGALLCVGK